MSDETNTEEVEKQQKLDMPEQETEEVTQADTQANKEEVRLWWESLESTPVGGASSNDKQQLEDLYDFGFTQVTDGENFSADEEPDKTEQSDTNKGFTVSEIEEHSNNEQQHEAPYDFGSPEVTDGENFSADEEPDKTEQSDTNKGFTVSEIEEHSNNEQQHEGSDDFEFYANFFMEIAKRDNLEYARDEENHDFKISLKADENTTHIQIDRGRNLTMTAIDNNNNETVVPDQQRFNDIAELAWQQGNYSITFGNIKTPEYAARLFIACKTHKPYPIEMTSVPEMDDEFLDNLSIEIRDQLDKIAGQETESKQDQTYDEVPTESQENAPVEEGVQGENEAVAIPIDDEVPTESQENDPVEEVVQEENKAVAIPIDDEVPTESQENDPVEEVVLDIPIYQEKLNHEFAAEVQEKEAQEKLANVWEKMDNRLSNPNQSQKEQNNLNTKKAQAQTNANILQNYHQR